MAKCGFQNSLWLDIAPVSFGQDTECKEKKKKPWTKYVGALGNGNRFSAP